jgi:hypothetical protein
MLQPAVNISKIFKGKIYLRPMRDTSFVVEQILIQNCALLDNGQCIDPLQRCIQQAFISSYHADNVFDYWISHLEEVLHCKVIINLQSEQGLPMPVEMVFKSDEAFFTLFFQVRLAYSFKQI